MAKHSLDTSLALRALSDDDLLTRLDLLAAQERENIASVVEHLMEVSRRELVLDRGYPSLYLYCIKRLHYSDQMAYSRIRAARAAVETPEILERLRSGAVTLDALVRIHPYLSPESAPALLDRIAGKKTEEVKALVATLQKDPAPERDVITPVAPAKRPEPSRSDSPILETGQPATPEVVPEPQHRFHFTADGELLNLVRRLKGLLRHKYPDGRLEEIFKEAAGALLERLERDRKPIPRAKQPLSGSVRKPDRSGSRVVPRSIKREVWARDGGRCAYVAPDGRRCESTDALEYDHIVAWADGGRSDTAENIRLLCRPHNQRLGRKRFGPRPKP